MLASTKYDLVLGLDFHIVVPPTGTPFLAPVPFVGMVVEGLAEMAVGAAISMAATAAYRQMGYEVAPGGVVLINGQPATTCEASATGLHILLPPLTFPGPTPSDAELWFGGYDVLINGSYAVRLGDRAVSCSDPLRLPTSTVLTIPKGKPVYIHRPMVLDLQAMATSIVTGAATDLVAHVLRGPMRLLQAFGIRTARRLAPRTARRLTRAITRAKSTRIASFYSKWHCQFVGEPVDVVSGRMVSEVQEFALDGALPVVFTRYYDSSKCNRLTSLGWGWSHSLEQAVWEERGKVVYLAEDGREIEFLTYDFPEHRLAFGQSVTNEVEHLTLTYEAPDAYRIETKDGRMLKFRSHEAEKKGAGNLPAFANRWQGAGYKLTDDPPERLHWAWIREVHDGTGATGAETRFSYDRNGRLIVQMRDRNGVQFFYQYDGHDHSARCIRTWGRNPNSAEEGIYDEALFYDIPRKRTMVTNALGHTTVYQWDEFYRVVQETGPTGAVTKKRYDERHAELVEQIDPLGRVTQWEYDDWGNLLKVIGPDGATMQLQYNEQHLPVRAIDPNGSEWQWQYSRQRQLLSATPPEGAVTYYNYDDQGRVVSTSVHRGPSQQPLKQEYRYDELGHLTRVLHPNGSETRVWHDVLGRLIKARDALGAEVELRYDKEGNLIERLLPMGLVEKQSYDAEDNLIEVHTPTRHVQMRYGGYYEVIERVEAGSSVRYEYDQEGTLTAVINENGDMHRLEHDPAGLLVAEVDYDGQKRTYIRDKAGQLIKRIGAEGEFTEYAYDDAGRPVKVIHADGSELTYTYRPDGSLLSATRTEKDGTTHEVSLVRDAMGRVVEESSRALHATAPEHALPARTLRSQYSPEGFLQAMQSSLGLQQTMQRNSFAEVTGIQWSGASTGFERNALGQETARVLPGGASLGQSYDALGRPLERRVDMRRRGSLNPLLKNLRLEQTSTTDRYRWRGMDQLAAIERVEKTSEELTEYSHDARGRAIAAQRRRVPIGTGFTPRTGNTPPAPAAPYAASPTEPRAPPAGAPPPPLSSSPPLAAAASFDADVLHRAMDTTGRIFPSGVPGVGRVYSPTGRLLEKEGGTRYRYDKRGRLVEKVLSDGAHTTYRWSDQGDLLEVRLPDERIVRFEYDAFSRRTRKAVLRLEPIEPKPFSALDPQHREVTESDTRYVWSGAVLLHEMHLRNAANKVAPNEPSAPSIQSLITWHYEPGSLTPLGKVVQRYTPKGEVESTKHYSVLTDHLGTPTELIDEAGVLAWKAQLDLYGIPRIEEGKPEDCPFRFQGQYHDEETGLHYNRYRYYDPEAGQYLTPDPIGLRGGIEPYAYVKDPTSWIDPLGLAAKCGTAKPKTIVVGENMERIRSAARANNARWYQAWEMDPFDKSVVMKRNRRWIRNKIREGYDVIDIGIDPSRPTRSDFYAMEKQEINHAGYPVTKLDWPGS
jgi:RHS repeat-associated protein